MAVDSNDADDQPQNPAPGIEAHGSDKETQPFALAGSPAPSTHDLFGKEIAVGNNVDGTAAQSTTPVDHAEAIHDEAITPTNKSVGSNQPREQDEQHPTTPAVVTNGPSTGLIISSPSRPGRVARKPPNHVLARRPSETVGENIFEMENWPHGTAKTVENSEGSPSPPERLPVLAG